MTDLEALVPPTAFHLFLRIYFNLRALIQKLRLGNGRIQNTYPCITLKKEKKNKASNTCNQYIFRRNI